MFSFNNIMKEACGSQRRYHNMPFHCFGNIDSQPDFCGPFNNSGHGQSGLGSVYNTFIQGEVPNFHQMPDLCDSIVRMFQMTGEMNKSKPNEKGNHYKKGQETNRKNRSETSEEEKQENNVPHPTVQDIVDHAMSFIHGTSESSKWQQQVDCRGFDSRNIKVKIDGNKILLKAFKRHESENGVRTMSMRKSVPLPENVNTKKIKCKFSEKGFMIIEAPYLDERESGNRQTFVKELMKLVVPGLEQLVQRIHDLTDEPEKENEDEKCAEKESRSNENENYSDLKPENVEVEDTNDKKQSNENDTENDVETKDENVDGVVEQDKVEFEAETTSQSLTIDTDFKTPAVDLSSSLEDASTTHEPIITFPADDDQTETPKSENDNDDDDLVSNASEDSFVLLSELEKENNNNQSEGNKESSTILKENEKSDDSVINSQKTSASKHNAHENNEPVLFRLEMPSYNPESMNVTFDNAKRLLSICASKNQDKLGSGNPQETTTKTVAIDDDVDVNSLQCYFRDGTLVVTAPRKVDIRHIPIRA